MTVLVAAGTVYNMLYCEVAAAVLLCATVANAPLPYATEYQLDEDGRVRWTQVTASGDVGTGNKANISSDGITWTSSTIPSFNWQSVAYGNGIFVAVALGPSTIAATSPDGITWTQRTLPVSAQWYSVTYGNGTFVAVAQGPSDIAATSQSNTLYTTPSNTSTVVSGIVAYNPTATSIKATLTLDGSAIWSDLVMANSTFQSLNTHQVLPEGKSIVGYTNNPGVQLHISGVEIS